MPAKKNKVQKKGRQATKSTRKAVQGELSEKDLDKVTGGHSIIAPRDPQTGQ